MEVIHLNELVKILGVGLTPATVGLVGYFLYRSIISELIDTKKELSELKNELESRYVRGDLVVEKMGRLEDTCEDLQRQIDRLECRR